MQTNDDTQETLIVRALGLAWATSAAACLFALELLGFRVEMDDEGVRCRYDYERAPVRADHLAHLGHCCEIHGCKYGEEEICPVATLKARREDNAGWCQEPGLVEDPKVCRRKSDEQ